MGLEAQQGHPFGVGPFQTLDLGPAILQGLGIQAEPRQEEGREKGKHQG